MAAEGGRMGAGDHSGEAASPRVAVALSAYIRSNSAGLFARAWVEST